MKKMNFVVGICLLSFVGCMKPYHEDLLVDIGTSEVAFLIETINDAGQASIAPPNKGEAIKNGETVDYHKHLISARKVKIPYYWKQTSRVLLWQDWSTGNWFPAARLIVVDTQPETREWHNDKDHGIWVESSDSVGFSTGISLTARIDNQESAIKFLSNYPPKSKRAIQTKGGEQFEVEVTSLEQIMDREIRTKIQEVFAYESAALNMNDLRESKQSIMDKIKEVVIPYFENRGITITTIGQFGGFKYENPKIQDAIDNVFQAQQDEEVAKAEAKAAEQRKLSLQLQGEGEAAKVLESKRGEAEGIKLVADAKAYELEKLQTNPDAYVQLKVLESLQVGLGKWDGRLPQAIFGGGSTILDAKSLLEHKQ